MPVRGLFGHRRVRLITTYTLALLQVHLLWLALFHHHDTLVLSCQSSTVQQSSGPLHAPVESALLCTACQIIRQSAARPAVGSPTPGAASSVPLRQFALRNLRPLVREVLVFGRAPPLS